MIFNMCFFITYQRLFRQDVRMFSCPNFIVQLMYHQDMPMYSGSSIYFFDI